MFWLLAGFTTKDTKVTRRHEGTRGLQIGGDGFPPFETAKAGAPAKERESQDGPWVRKAGPFRLRLGKEVCGAWQESAKSV